MKTRRKKLAIGMWEDAEGNLFLSLGAILKSMDIPNTLKNRQNAYENIQELIRRGQRKVDTRVTSE